MAERFTLSQPAVAIPEGVSEAIRIGNYVLKSVQQGKPADPVRLPFVDRFFDEGPSYLLVPRDVLEAIWHDPLIGPDLQRSLNFYNDEYKLLVEIERKKLVQIRVPGRDMVEQFFDSLDRYIKSHAEVAADGSLVYSVPQIWFRDP